MRLVRIGEPGSEKAAVLGPSNELFRIPESFGDIDDEFWRQNRMKDLSRLLQQNALSADASEFCRFGPPISKPEKVICIGLNYRDHASETGSAFPDEPIVFMKAPNTVIGPNDSIHIPRGSTKTDWEVELGVVISQRARYLETPAR
jgi:2-keto-4-pentenoate hydratase/2-oxohepta-3-ene-1,7-dioic acid hydratase in catechol pathway